MIERKSGTKRPMSSLRHSFLIAVVLLVCALVLVTPTAAMDEWNGDTATGFATGSGTESDPYQIETGAQLAYLAQQVNGGTTYEGTYFILTDDIDLNNIGWSGIGIYEETGVGTPFSGTFDGDNKIIHGMIFADTSSNKYRGLFNQLYKATVKDLTVEGNGFVSTISGTYGGAMIAGHAYESTIENCVSQGSFTGTHNVAGIVVRIKDAQIIDCTNKADLTGSYTKMGGIVCLSQNSATGCLIAGCTNEGKITSTAQGNDGVGGIIGWIGSRSDSGSSADEGQRVTIKDCENKGIITAATDTNTAVVGQIVGKPLSYWSIQGTNKGLTTTLAVGDGATNGLNFATVEENVATYTELLIVGNSYLVTAPNAEPVIELGSGESITFDTSLAALGDDTGIKAVSALDVEESTTDSTKITYTAQKAVASVDGKYYATLQAAIDAAKAGETVTLLDDTTEAMVYVKNNKNVKINFAENTLYGSMFVNKTATADLYDGSIIQEATVAGIEVQGITTLTNMNIESARHAIRVDGLSTEGTLLTVNSGTYQSKAPTEWTAHAINAGEGSSVIIKDGTFIGAAAANAGGSGNCVMVKADTTVTIEGGTFYGANGVEGPICAAAGLTISGGTFTDTTDSWRYSNYFTDGKYWAFEAAETIEHGKKTWEVKPAVTITWIDGDATTPLAEEKVAVGETPKYTGNKKPYKADDAQYIYTWNGVWTPNVVEATVDATYTAFFTNTPKKYTITWKNYDGSEFYREQVAYGEMPEYSGAIPKKPADTKIYTFSGWDPERSAVAGDAMYTAQFTGIDADITSFDYQLNTASPVTVTGNSNLILPINFINSTDSIYKPDTWQINVTVFNEQTDITSQIDIDNINLEVKSGYYTNIEGLGFKKSLGKFEVRASPYATTTGTVEDLFTLTIAGLPASNDCKVVIEIMTSVAVSGDNGLAQKNLIEVPVKVSWLIGMDSNIYATSTNPWSFENNVWANLTVANPGQGEYLSSESVILVYRDAAKTYGLNLLTSGNHEIIMVDAQGKETVTTATKIENANGMIKMNVAESDKDAAQFIIKFTGSKVGDVANVKGQADTVNVIDVSYILHEATSPNYIKDGHAVYGDVDQDGTISSFDAVAVFKYSLNKATKEDMNKVLIQETA